MALQDRTLANTAAKMSMEAKRRRNTEIALAAMQPGVRRRGELPAMLQHRPGGPSAYAVPEAPWWLRRASDWLTEPGYSRESVVPMVGMVDYARTVAEGRQPTAMQTVSAGLDLPVPGLSVAEASLGGLGSLLLGVTRRAGTPAVPRMPEEGVSRAWLNQVDVAPGIPMAPQPRTRGPDYVRAFEKRKNKGRMEEQPVGPELGV